MYIYEVTKLIIKRLISLLLAVIIAAAIAVTPIFAAEEPHEEDETVKPTVKPTQAPTEPPFTAENYGYAEYAKRLDTTVYDGELGAEYSPDETTFRLWSPVASSVKVCIYKTGSDSEKGAQTLSTNPMKRSAANGGWYLTLDGDYKNLYYTYKVTVEGKTHEVVDPYAKAVGVNGNRGMIVDMDELNPKGWSSDSFDRVFRATEAVVWEVSVRDFSADESSGVSEKNRGKFLAFTEGDTTLNGVEGDIPTCVNYLKQLGVNYVQINPFYDFASIDEAAEDSDQYNWGYDPKNYNVPEGSYSSDPYDGRVRITECKQMIQALHNAGIGVIMDVVYNHTYYSQDSFLNQIVPDYYYRIGEDGKWSNGSGCGNDVATERHMVRKFITDSVTYWAQEYHIDGFRFDLMGLMDAETMGAVRQSLDNLPGGNRILMYGEGWNMTTETTADLATQDNMYLLSKRIGAFNDSGRDSIKGSTFNPREGGFVQDGSRKDGIRGMIDADAAGWATVPNQVVNYTSCHDNLTLYDKLYSTVYNGSGYSSRYEDLVAMNKLSAAIVMMTRGMPFMLAGEEFARTKGGDENSYKSPVEVNRLDWERIRKFPSLVEYYRGLIRLRGSLDVLKDSSNDTQVVYLDTDGGDCVAYQGIMENAPMIVAAFNGSNSESSKVTLPDGKWVMLADGERAGLNSLGTYTGSVEVPHTSAVVLVNAAGYKRIGVFTDEASLYVRCVDTKNGVTVYEEKYTGNMGDSYDIKIPDEVLFRYNLTGSQKALSGTFDTSFKVITVECEKYEGNYSSVTFRYLNDFDENISNSIVISNRVGQQYYSQPIPAIPGYVLDLDKLPDNGAGVYTDKPIEVVYHYKPADSIVAPQVDSSYNSRANVIYMGSDGEILDVKTYLGVEGDPVEVEELEFKGYKFHGKSDNYATFSIFEANIIVNYEKQVFNWLPIIIIGGVALILIGAVVFYFIGRDKRKKIESIEIEEF